MGDVILSLKPEKMQGHERGIETRIRSPITKKTLNKSHKIHISVQAQKLSIVGLSVVHRNMNTKKKTYISTIGVQFLCP